MTSTETVTSVDALRPRAGGRMRLPAPDQPTDVRSATLDASGATRDSDPACHRHEGRPAITVVLADDEVLLRKALASLLPLEGNVTVLAEAADGAQAVTATLTHRPDVLILDLEMPGTDGLQAVAEIRRTLPDQAILILTRHARPGVLRSALKLGVQGFASKSTEPSHLASAITTLHRGHRWIDQDVSAAAIIDDCPLTDRELEALRVTSDGYSVAEIAVRMHLAPGTVRNYLSNAIQKTQTRTRHEAARYAREHGWL